MSEVLAWYPMVVEVPDHLHAAVDLGPLLPLRLILARSYYILDTALTWHIGRKTAFKTKYM